MIAVYFLEIKQCCINYNYAK